LREGILVFDQQQQQQQQQQLEEEDELSDQDEPTRTELEKNVFLFFKNVYFDFNVSKFISVFSFINILLFG